MCVANTQHVVLYVYVMVNDTVTQSNCQNSNNLTQVQSYIIPHDAQSHNQGFTLSVNPYIC